MNAQSTDRVRVDARNVRVLRIWPAVLLVLLMVAARYAPNFMEGGLSEHWMLSVFGPMLCCLLLVIWWVTASRASAKERVFGFLGIVAGLVVTLVLVDPSMRGPGTTFLTLPMGMIAFVIGAAVAKRSEPMKRTGTALAFMLVAFLLSATLRTDGMTGDYVLTLRWRWKPSLERDVVAERNVVSPTETNGLSQAQMKAMVTTPDWPGFRGWDRSGRSRHAAIATNWASNPPKQLWKVPVGPAWSSFAVAGKLLFTQEQRGPNESVVCYHADTGKEIWVQQVETRFDEPLGGPGPRATPTLANGALYVTGATGMILRLDPTTGAVVWKQDLKTVAGRKPHTWGFAASPLVTEGHAIIYAGGADGKGLIAFDVGTGEVEWTAHAGNDTYCSPQLSRILGEDLVLIFTNEGLTGVDPLTGKEHLNYPWKFMNYRALQPAVVGDDTIILATGMNVGTRAIRVAFSQGKLTTEDVWALKSLKPDFTDFVIFNGHWYGIDGGLFTCVDLKTGERKWKGGRYGKGQATLLEQSGVVLIAAEDGRVVLVRADPENHSEVASFQALEGKTWNHPVVVEDRLYVRNAQEAAAFQLDLANVRRSEK